VTTTSACSPIPASASTARRIWCCTRCVLPDIGYVKAGVVEIIEKQKLGWAVVRP